VSASGKGRRRAGGAAECARGIHHDPERHAFVGDPESLRAPRVDSAAGEQQIERGGRAGKTGQSSHPAPCGDDAEHHLGQPQPRPGLVDDDPVTTGEREFQPAAEAEPADQRKRRVRRGCELVERIPAALDERGGIVDRLQLRELVDVGAGDEAVVLAGPDHESLRRRSSKLAEDGEKLAEYLARQRVRRRARLVEDEPGEAIAVAL
jgi:hypothetical protein